MIVIITIFLAGCTSHSLDRTAAQNIHRIALLGPSGPETYTLRSQAPGRVGTVLGLVGFAAAYAIAQIPANNTSDQFNELMKQRRLDIMGDVAASVEAALRAKGYDVVRVPIPRTDASASLDLGSDVAPGADTLIDLTFMAGYSEVGEDGAWAPIILSKVRAYNSRTRALLFRVITGCAIKGSTPDTKRFLFPHTSELLDRPQDAADGLRACAKLVGGAVAKQFGS